MNGKYTIIKSTVECYKIRHSSGMYWADITVDSNDEAGRIMIASDFGDWQYYWGHCGKPFKEFLLKIGKDYVASKFGESKHFDLESTLKGYKERIIESRRDDRMDAVKARTLWDEIIFIDEYCSDDINQFYQVVSNDCENLMEYFDQSPDVSEKISPQFEKFWSMLWPEFTKWLQEEILNP